jgi:sec-independent protein translocase protein TatB
MFNIGPQELLIVLVLALIVVGPQKLPELSRQIGRGLREFRKVQDEVKGMVKFDLDDTTDRTTPATRPTGAASKAGAAPRVHRSARPSSTVAGDVDTGPEAPSGGEPPPANTPG